MRVGAVVLAYGDASERHFPVVAELAAVLSPNDIIVVHNRSGDRCEHVPRPPQPVEVIVPDRNLGYAAGMNLGWRALRRDCDFIVLCTHDVRVTGEQLKSLLAAIFERPDLGQLGPMFVAGQRTYAGGVFTPLGVARWRPTVATGTNRVGQVDWIDGSLVVLRRSAIGARSAPFDDRYFMYGEDVELSCWLRRHGWGVGVLPSVRIASSPGDGKRPGAFRYLYSRNRLETVRLYLGWRTTARALVHEAGELVRHVRTEGFTCSVARVELSRLVGILHFVLRRFGPPPTWLPSRGDVEGT